jgi:thiamine-phosphate pyrophosphorylase
LDQAILDGASYLGVGPVFPSKTKGFQEFVGLGLVEHAAESTKLSWFAIGGIDVQNLDEVLNAGAIRVAVSSAIIGADRPREAAQLFRDRLDAMD